MKDISDIAKVLIRDKKYKELLLGTICFQWVDKLWGAGHSKGSAMTFLMSYLSDNRNDERLIASFISFVESFSNDESLDEISKSYNWLLIFRMYAVRAVELDFWPISQRKLAECIVRQIRTYKIDTIKKYNVLKEADYMRKFTTLPEWTDVFTEEQIDYLSR
jgi:hypothetical protein